MTPGDHHRRTTIDDPDGFAPSPAQVEEDMRQQLLRAIGAVDAHGNVRISSRMAMAVLVEDQRTDWLPWGSTESGAMVTVPAGKRWALAVMVRRDEDVAHVAEAPIASAAHELWLVVEERVSLIGLERVAGMNNLTMLHVLSRPTIRRRELAVMARPVHLRHLDLSDTRHLPAKTLEGLKSFERLQSLVLSSAGLTDADIAPIADLSTLQHLDLSQITGLTDAGLAHLSGLGNLLSIDCSGSHQLTDAGLAHLANLDRLEEVLLRDCPGLTDAGLEVLKRLRVCSILALSNNPNLSDAGLAMIAGNRGLTHLDITGCPRITDAGLTHLHAIKGLLSIHAGGLTGCTSEGLKALMTALPNCTVRVS